MNTSNDYEMEIKFNINTKTKLLLVTGEYFPIREPDEY